MAAFLKNLCCVKNSAECFLQKINSFWREKKITFLVLILICVALIPLALNIPERANDFATFYDVAVVARAGGNIADPAGTTGMIVYYLPYFAFLLIPFTLFSQQVASILFFYANVLLFVWTFADSLQFFDGTKKKWIAGIVLAIILLPYVGMNLNLGQVNLLIGCSIYWALRWFADRAQVSGFILAAVAFKVIPLFLAAFVVFSKRVSWMIAYCTATVMFFLLPLTRLSVDSYVEAWRDIFFSAGRDKITLAALVVDPVHSFWGIFAKVSLVLGNTQTLGIKIAVLFLAAAFLFWAATQLWQKKEWGNEIYIWGTLFTLGMFLFSPDARPAHFTMLILPISWTAVLAIQKGQRFSQALLALMVVANLFYSADIVGRSMYEAATHALLYSVILLLMAGQFLILAKNPKPV